MLEDEAGQKQQHALTWARATSLGHAELHSSVCRYVDGVIVVCQIVKEGPVPASATS
jgi:hypothetical protein